MSSTTKSASSRFTGTKFSPQPLEPCAATPSLFLHAYGSDIHCLHRDSLKLERRFTQHSEDVVLIDVNNVSDRRASRLAVSYDASQTAIIWDIPTGEEISRFASYDPIRVASWMRNGSLVFGDSKGDVIIFDPELSEHISTRTIFDPITAISAANDCQTYALGYQNGSILIATIEPTFNILHTLTKPRTPSTVVSLAWHASSVKQKADMLATQTANGDLDVWSIPKRGRDDPPRVIRALRRPNASQGTKWMAWSRNGQIVQYAGGDTWLWDVRTKTVTYRIVPSVPVIKGMAAYGPSSILFTLGPDNSVQQYDLEGCYMVAEAVLNSWGMMSESRRDSPMPHTNQANSLASQNLVTTSSSSRPFTPIPPSEFETEASRRTPLRRPSSIPRVYGTPTRSLTPTALSTSSRGYSYSSRSKPPTIRSNHSGTAFSMSSTLPSIVEVPGYSGGDSASYATSISRTSDARSSRRHRSSRQSSYNSSFKEQPIQDLFPNTRERLHNVPYQTPRILDEKGTTPDELRRHMLHVVFGWKGDIEDLIQEELASHPPGSPHSVLLSRWLGDINPSLMMSQISSGFGQNQMNWMLLALTQLGSQTQTKMLGQTFVQQLLMTGDVHAAAAVLLGLGDANDAIEVYVSRNMYLEAILMTCLIMPLEWERQAFLIRQWGEHVVKNSQQHLAIRCFSCIKAGPPEALQTPSVQLASILSDQIAAQSQDISFDQTINPPIHERKTPALKLVTSFDDRTNGNSQRPFPSLTPVSSHKRNNNPLTAFDNLSPMAAEFYSYGRSDLLENSAAGDVTAIPCGSSEKVLSTPFHLLKNHTAADHNRDDATTTSFEGPSLFGSTKYNPTSKGSNKSDVAPNDIRALAEEKKAHSSRADSRGRRPTPISINNNNVGAPRPYTPRGLTSRAPSPAITAHSVKSMKTDMSSRSIDRYLSSLDEANSYYQRRPFDIGLSRPRGNTDTNTRGSDIIVLPPNVSDRSRIPPQQKSPSLASIATDERFAGASVRSARSDTTSLRGNADDRSRSRPRGFGSERATSRQRSISSKVDGPHMPSLRSLHSQNPNQPDDQIHASGPTEGYPMNPGQARERTRRQSDTRCIEREPISHPGPSSFPDIHSYRERAVPHQTSKSAIDEFSMKDIATMELDKQMAYSHGDPGPSEATTNACGTGRDEYSGASLHFGFPTALRPVNNLSPAPDAPDLKDQRYFQYGDIIERSISAPIGFKNSARAHDPRVTNSISPDQNSHYSGGLRFSDKNNEHDNEGELLPQTAYIPPSKTPLPPPPPPPPFPPSNAEKVSVLGPENRNSMVSAVTIHIGIDNDEHQPIQERVDENYILPARAMETHDQSSWGRNQPPYASAILPTSIDGMI